MRTMTKLQYFILAYFTAFTAIPAYADTWLDCPALMQDASYKNRESLKYLTLGQEKWIFISEKDFKTDFALKQETVTAFQKFQKQLKNYGTELVLVIPPPRGLIHSNKIVEPSIFNAPKARESFNAMLNQLKTAGIPVGSIADISNTANYGYERDHHWNNEGAKNVAMNTAEQIQKLSAYTAIKKQKFTLQSGQETEFKGSFYNPIKDICGINLPAHLIKKQTFTNDDQGLFDDEKSEITLVGTSFSETGKSMANFAGHLRYSLSAEIDNQALGGGGISKSLITYLKSDRFKTDPPKILIWEIPGFYSLNRVNLLNDAAAITENK